MTIIITSFSAASDDEIFINLQISSDGNTENKKILISSSAFAELGLNKGECSIEKYESIEKISRSYLAYKRGLYILSYGACSKRMLISKLIAKGFDKGSSIDAAEKLSDAGFLCEEENAYREAQKDAAKLWGLNRIKASLIQKGYSSSAIESALFSLEDEGIDFTQSCVLLLDKRYPKLPTDRTEVQKLISALSRYGYSVSQIKAAYTRLVKARQKNSLYRD